jgi:hypothetical protein
VALALWKAGDAVFDFNHLPRKQKFTKKLQAAGYAVVFSAFALTLASFAVGARQDNRQSARDLTIAVIQAPGGVALLVLAGSAVAITGVVYVVRGFRQSFAKYLRWPASSPARRAVKVVGVAGYGAKGIALLLAGLLIIIATVQAHPEQSTGLDGALRALRDQPLGVYALAVVGAGLGCYGVFQVVRARFGRM